MLDLRPYCCCSCPLAATRIYWKKLQLLRACCRWKYIKIFATYSRLCARLPSSAASQITGEKKGGWKQHEALANNRRRRRTLSSLHFIARRRPIPPNTAERSLALYITRTELFGADRPPHIVNTRNYIVHSQRLLRANFYFLDDNVSLSFPSLGKPIQ